MKQSISKTDLTKLSAKYMEAKLQLQSASQKARATGLKARAARERQKVAKKTAHAARDRARVAKADLQKAERTLAKAEARLAKARKKIARHQPSRPPRQALRRSSGAKVPAAFARNAASSAGFARATTQGMAVPLRVVPAKDGTPNGRHGRTAPAAPKPTMIAESTGT
jgi:hypothetical protein